MFQTSLIWMCFIAQVTHPLMPMLFNGFFTVQYLDRFLLLQDKKSMEAQSYSLGTLFLIIHCVDPENIYNICSQTKAGLVMERSTSQNMSQHCLASHPSFDKQSYLNVITVVECCGAPANMSQLKFSVMLIKLCGKC